jgi:ferredoxin
MKEWSRQELEEEIVGKMAAITIPVNIRIDSRQRVLDLSEMEATLRKARIISQQECGCRKMMGNCIEPMDGCLGIDDVAESMIKGSGSRRVTVEEALEALKRTYAAGLVHLAYVHPGQDMPFMICSCCDCCCHTMGPIRKYGYENQIFPSGLIARQDMELCTACGSCETRCRFGARHLEQGTLFYESAKCFGCGLCLEPCPAGAISMAKRG